MPAEADRPTPRGVRLARANGLGYLVFGVLTILASLSAAGLDTALGVWLTSAGLVERRAAGALERAEAGASTTLSRNELAGDEYVKVMESLRRVTAP